MEVIKEELSVHGAPTVETRAADDGGDSNIIKIGGYGAVFNKTYKVHGFKERVAPGAFTKTLAEQPDVLGMFNHSPNHLLGRTSSGTMDVSQDEKGLAYEIRASKRSSVANDVVDAIERGDVNGSSMAFFVHREEWEEKDGKPQVRTIKEIELIETGPVVMPASSATSSKIQRALEETEIDFEALMGLAIKRRAGFRLEAAEDDLVAQTIKRLERLKADPESATEHPLSPAMALEYSRAAWTLRTRMAALSLA